MLHYHEHKRDVADSSLRPQAPEEYGDQQVLNKNYLAGRCGGAEREGERES